MSDRQVCFANSLNYLTPAQMHRVHDTSMHILEKTGCRVLYKPAMALLEENGATVGEENRVFIPASLVTRALVNVPDSITMYDRMGNPAMILENTNVYYGTGSDCQYLLDHGTGEVREFTFPDVKDAVRLADALSHINFLMSMGLAEELDDKNAFQRKYAAMLRGSVKPQIVITGPDIAALADIVDMASAAMGGENLLSKKPLFLLLVDPTSPLVHSEDAIEKLVFMAGKKLPVIYAPGIMAGATGPVTIAGAIAQANAEILTGLVIHQLTSPGSPFVYGGGMSPMDMSSGQPTYSSPEAMVSQAGLCQLGRSFYKLPTYGFGGCTVSKTFDQQAANEAATYLMMAAWSGTNLIHDVGYMEFGMTYSFELMAFCNEVIGQIRRMMEGIDIDSEHLAIDSIDRVGPGGTFLTDSHTFKHFKKNWHPETTDRKTRQTWEEQGAMTMGDRTRRQIQDILKNHVPERLPVEVDAKIERILHRAGGR